MTPYEDIRVALGGRRKPLIGNEQTAHFARELKKAGNILFTGKDESAEKSDTSDLDLAIKYNQAMTGTPDFELKKARVMADVRGQEALELERAKRGMAQQDYRAALEREGGAPQRGRKYDASLGAFVDEPEPASVKTLRLKELDSLAGTAENVRQQSGAVERATRSLPNVKTGLWHNARRGFLRLTGQDVPELADWQGLKSILTNTQLDYSDRTKGAISDREMATFAKAVANDDFATVMQMKHVLRAYYDKLHGGLESGMSAYEDMFNDDPRKYKSLQNLPAKDPNLFGDPRAAGAAGQGNTPNMPSFASPEEADASGLPAGTIVMVSGRRYEIG